MGEPRFRGFGVSAAGSLSVLVAALLLSRDPAVTTWLGVALAIYVAGGALQGLQRGRARRTR